MRPVLKIGEFARLAHVSIATLRYYDQVGLLKPAVLDPESSYRYYRIEQLARLHRIVALKELDFPLEQIATMLMEDLSPEQLQALFRRKQVQTQQLIAREQLRLRRLAARIREVEKEGNMPRYDVRLKQVEPVLVASIRARVPDISHAQELQATLTEYLEREQIAHQQPPILILHSRHELRDGVVSIDLEVAQPVAAYVPETDLITCRSLPATLVACIIHTGTERILGHAYGVLQQWMADNEYQFGGPPRQIELQIAGDEIVTEIQFPIVQARRDVPLPAIEA